MESTTRSSDALRRLAGMPVPTRQSLLHTMGALALLWLPLQVFTGILLLVHYIPDERHAYDSVAAIQFTVPLGWLVRQIHAWGASLLVLALILHVLRTLWHGAYKRPRRITWVSGLVLLGAVLGSCFSGYLLPWNQLSFWATRVALGMVESVPLAGPQVKALLCGGPDVTGATLGRFFALHVAVLPWALVLFLAAHALLVWKHGFSPRSSVAEEAELGRLAALEKHGAEPFFPGYVYRAVRTFTVALAAVVTLAAFWPWELGDRASLETPEGIRPEWYFLPVYQFLKYFDNELYARLPFLETLTASLGVAPAFVEFLAGGFVGGVLLLLPWIDRNPQRAISRRPFFLAALTLFLAASLLLGALGHLSGRTLTVFGRTYEFSDKGYPERVEGVSKAPGPGSSPTTDARPVGGSEARPAEPQDKVVPAGTGRPAAPAAAYRPDGLSAGGTCGGADCHAKELQEWSGSVHHEGRVECRGCHGGIDTPPPAELAGLTPEAYAHLGIRQKKGGGASRPPRSEIPDFCGKCHENVRSAFSPLHFEKSPEGFPKATCVNCHSNHSVASAGDPTYENAYADPEDPRRALLQAERKILSGLSARAAGLKPRLQALARTGYPAQALLEEIGGAERTIDESRPLIHGLDPSRLESAVGEAREVFDEIDRGLSEAAASTGARWMIPASAWAVAVASILLLRLGLSRRPPASGS
jgi:ubiquinol-cytochrome c reductase cytochrome b subunit